MTCSNAKEIAITADRYNGQIRAGHFQSLGNR